MKTNIGISEKNSAKLATILNQLLADHFLLYTKTRNFHWNVTGPSFIELHKLFEAQYDALAINVDDIAERIRSRGHIAAGSMKDFIALSKLEETPEPPKAEKMIKILTGDYEAIIQSIRGHLDEAEKCGDQGTVDFLTGLMEAHEKTAWMLRAHIE